MNLETEMQHTYTVLIEQGPTSWGAYIPDIPGCFAVAETEEEVKQLIVEAGLHHLQMLAEEGLPLPEPLQVTQHQFQLA